MGEPVPGGGPKPRARHEWVIILVVLVAGVGVAFGLLQARGKAQKSEALMRDLSQLRSAVTLYKMVKKENPTNLERLASETYNLAPGEATKPFLATLKPAVAGQFLDPFGNAYAYDQQKGWVHSTSRGFENW